MSGAKNNGDINRLCVPFQVQAIKKIAPGVICSSSNILGRIFSAVDSL